MSIVRNFLTLRGGLHVVLDTPQQVTRLDFECIKRWLELLEEGLVVEDEQALPVVPACCIGCLNDHGGMVGCGVFQRRPVGNACWARVEAEEG